MLETKTAAPGAKNSLHGDGELTLQENEVDPEEAETELAVEVLPVFDTCIVSETGAGSTTTERGLENTAATLLSVAFAVIE
jgi:hypothetical protein